MIHSPAIPSSAESNLPTTRSSQAAGESLYKSPGLIKHILTVCSLFSHIFCSECAKQFGLTQPENQGRTTCPACNVQLAKADSIFFTNLNPTEEYKACILSGLSPSIVMECAGRAVGFWAYQVTQNLHYQRHLCKTLQEKYSDLWARCEQITRHSDARINGLRGKLEG